MSDTAELVIPDKLPPLPPVSGQMVQMTAADIKPLHGDSFISLEGFDAAEIRDFGVEQITNNAVGATVLRAREEAGWEGSPWHMHDKELFVFILSGSALFEFDGVGPATFEKGTFIHQPAFSRHRELTMSRDFEALAIQRPGGPVATTFFIWDDVAGTYREVAEDFEGLAKHQTVAD